MEERQRNARPYFTGGRREGGEGTGHVKIWSFCSPPTHWRQALPPPPIFQNLSGLLNTACQPHSRTRAGNIQLFTLALSPAVEEPKMFPVRAFNLPPHNINSPQMPPERNTLGAEEKTPASECAFSASLSVPKQSKRVPKDALERGKEALETHSRKTTVGQETRGGHRRPNSRRSFCANSCSKTDSWGLKTLGVGNTGGPISFAVWTPNSSLGLCSGGRSTASFRPQPSARVPPQPLTKAPPARPHERLGGRRVRPSPRGVRGPPAPARPYLGGCGRGERAGAGARPRQTPTRAAQALRRGRGARRGGAAACRARTRGSTGRTPGHGGTHYLPRAPSTRASSGRS